MSTPIGQTAESAASIVRRYLDSFASASPETVAGFVSADFVNQHTAGLGSGCSGRAEYQSRLSNFFAEMIEFAYTVEHLVSDPGTHTDGESQVAVFYEMSARWQGVAPFSMRGAQRLTVQHGLITNRVDYWDSAVFLSLVDPRAQQALAAMGISPGH